MFYMSGFVLGAVKVVQSCPTICDSMDYTVHGILQARYWSGQPFSSPGDLPNPRIKLRFTALQADSLPTELSGTPGLEKGRSAGEGKKLPTPGFWPGELVHAIAKSQTGLSDFHFHQELRRLQSLGTSLWLWRGCKIKILSI